MDVDVCMQDLSQNQNVDYPMKQMKEQPKMLRSGRTFGTNITNVRGNQSQPNKAKASFSSSDSLEPVKKKRKLSEEKKAERSIPAWDRPDVNNELAVVDYIDDIIESCHQAESKIGVLKDYMAKQSNINSRMRVVLLDWIIDVHRKFELVPSTLHLCINILDRFLSLEDIHRKKLQLTGCACLWIASKYHEIYAPEVDDFVYISDNAFTREELIAMEGKIVSQLEFALTVPTPLSFIERYVKFTTFNLQKEQEKRIITDLINYCAEHILLDYHLTVGQLPSALAATAVCYAVCATRLIHTKQQWNNIFVKKCGIPHTFEALLPMLEGLDSIVKSPGDKCRHKAVRKKYKATKFSRVALMSFKKLDLSTFR